MAVVDCSMLLPISISKSVAVAWLQRARNCCEAMRNQFVYIAHFSALLATHCAQQSREVAASTMIRPSKVGEVCTLRPSEFRRWPTRHDAGETGRRCEPNRLLEISLFTCEFVSMRGLTIRQLRRPAPCKVNQRRFDRIGWMGHRSQERLQST